jgi:4-alpha-glucanotransferase
MYESFLNSISSRAWQKAGLKRRSGVAVPLFSIFSKKSIGIGDFEDLKLMIDWASHCGMSIVQLLPMNDTGFHFAPYSALSTFALDPMYLSLEKLTGVPIGPFQPAIRKLRAKFPPGRLRVNYQVKRAKLKLLWAMFKKVARKLPADFQEYVETNQYWLYDYALFKVAKEIYDQKNWEDWFPELRTRQLGVLRQFEKKHHQALQFQMWLQWQSALQFKKVKRHARAKKMLLMGDLPFLVARDSADVWAHPRYFKLDFSSGAPPDTYFAKGQSWGSPPYRWTAVAKDGYRYPIERLRYVQHFYDAFRIDHSVGFFRLWSIPGTEPAENGGLNGAFDPPEEDKWEGQGRELLSLLVQSTFMLPCAEDLGTVPECSFRVLHEFAIPGTDIQRWSKNPSEKYEFKTPETYRENSIAAISTHDMTSFSAWWDYEANTVYGPLLKRACENKGINFNRVKGELFDLTSSAHERLRWKVSLSEEDLIRILGKAREEIGDFMDVYRFSYDEKARFWSYVGLSGACEEKSSPKLLKAALWKISTSASIFSIQMLQDWLGLTGLFQGDSWEVRINFPGTVGKHNWSLVIPVSLEKMKKLASNRDIRKINRESGRI